MFRNRIFNRRSRSEERENQKKYELGRLWRGEKSELDDKIFIPPGNRLFVRDDPDRCRREVTMQRNLSELSLIRASDPVRPNERAHEVSQITTLWALPRSYDMNAPKTSRRSAMSIVAELNSKIYPTNLVIDPFMRAPVLDKYEDSRLEIESEEELPRMSGRPSRMQYKLKAGLTACGKTGFQFSEDRIQPGVEGRNIISLYEYTVLAKRYNDPHFKQISFNIKDLSDGNLETMVTKLLTNTTGPFAIDLSMSRNDKEAIIKEVLACFGFPKEAWSNGIVMCLMDTSANAALENNYLNASGNCYKTPVYVDMSVIHKYWVTKELVNEGTQEVVPTYDQRKRPIADVTVHESEAKFMKDELSLAKIGEGIKKLTSLTGQVLTARGQSAKGILCEEHDEVASQLVGMITEVQLKTEKELSEIKSEKTYTSERLKEARNRIQEYETEITTLHMKIETLEIEKKNLEESAKNTARSAGVENEISEEAKSALNAKLDELESIKKKLAEKSQLCESIKNERDRLQEKLSELTDRMDESLRIKEEASRMDISLSENITKNNEDMAKSFMSPIKPGIANPSFDQTLESDDEQFFSPNEKTLHKKTKPTLAQMTLTPNKIGLQKWEENLQSFGQWFASMRMQIEAAIQAVNNEVLVIRLILMCLPSKYSWVANAIADDTSIDKVDKAKTEILKLIYGENGLMNEFFALRRGTGEHPMTFLQRIATTLDSEDMDSKFLLKSIQEKLATNLDNPTNVELQRLLTAIGQSNLTFKKLKTSLQTAIKLTGNQNDSKSINKFGNEILTAIQRLDSKVNKCYNCGSTTHFANKCPDKRKESKPNFKKKSGSYREPKTKSDGRRFSCYKCGKPGHYKKDCKSKSSNQ